MKSRLIAAAIAVVLAAVGTVVLIGYVRGADARAASGFQTVEVLVVSAPIPKGTPGADLPALVASKRLPAAAALPNRVTNLDRLADKVALIALDPGEQLLDSKFGPAATSAGELTVAPNLQQVTVLLELQRALGGRIEAGDTVGMFLSVKDSKQTQLTAHKVQVTAVQRAATGNEAAAASETDTTTAAPTSAALQPAPTDLSAALLVTVATTAAISEKIVFAAEFGSIWLSDEPLTADEAGTKVVDGITVFQ